MNSGTDISSYSAASFNTLFTLSEGFVVSLFFDFKPAFVEPLRSALFSSWSHVFQAKKKTAVRFLVAIDPVLFYSILLQRW